MSTAEQHLDAQEQGSFTNGNRLMQALLIAAIAASSLSMIFSVGTAMASAGQEQPAAGVAASE
ncbi:MAG: hypothetical protein ACF8LL_05210 [Phycisphaerales bacterium]|jgi:hypothetical protein